MNQLLIQLEDILTRAIANGVTSALRQVNMIEQQPTQVYTSQEGSPAAAAEPVGPTPKRTRRTKAEMLAAAQPVIEARQEAIAAEAASPITPVPPAEVAVPAAAADEPPFVFDATLVTPAERKNVTAVLMTIAKSTKEGLGSAKAYELLNACGGKQVQDLSPESYTKLVAEGAKLLKIQYADALALDASKA